MKRVALIVVMAAVCFQAASFVYAQQGSRILIPDKNVRVYPGKTAETCIAAGSMGVYEVDRKDSRRLIGRKLLFTPDPAINSDSTLLAYMVDNADKALLEILDMERNSVRSISLTEYPSAWEWKPNQDELVIAMGKKLYHLDMTSTKVRAYRHKYPGIIQSVKLNSTGEQAVMTVSMGDTKYTQSMLVSLNKEEKPRNVSSYSYGITWIDDKRIAYIKGQGEPDSLVYTQKLDEEGQMVPISQGVRQIAALGTPGIAQGLSASPQGDILAILTHVNSPIDFFGEDASYYSNHIVEFVNLRGKSEGGVRVTPMDIFAWSPSKNVYGLAQKRIHEKPGYENPETSEAKEDYELQRSTKTETMRERNYDDNDSLLISDYPIESICWSRDGSRMYAVEQLNRSVVWCFPANR